MTKRGIVKDALRFGLRDRVPYNVDFTRDAREKMARFLRAEDVDLAVGNYFLQVNVGSNAGPEIGRVAEGLMQDLGGQRYRDEFGVVWLKSAGDDIGVPQNTVLPEAILAGFDFPDPAVQTRFRGYAERVATAGDRYVLAGFSSPFFQRAWFLRGLANWLADLALHPEFVEALLDGLLDFSVAIVDEVAERGADGMFFLDDYGQQSGMLFSPVMFRRFFTPRVTRLMQHCRARGLDTFFHSCGDVTPILEDLCAAGVQVFNPLQPECMDIAAVKRRFARRMAFYGGLSTQRTLPFGTPDQVRRDTRELVTLLTSDRGSIVAAAHAVQRDVPEVNTMAMIEELQNARVGG